MTREGEARTWSTAKVKDGKDDTTHGFKLDVEQLGFDEDGDQITSCVVSAAEIVPTAKREVLTPAETTALKAYEVAVSAAGKVDRHGALLGVHVEDWRRSFYTMSTADTSHAKKLAFQRARNSLVERGRMSVSDDVYSISRRSFND